MYFYGACIVGRPSRLGENLIKAAALLVRAFTNYRTKWDYIMRHLHSAIIMPRDFEITIPLQHIPPPPFSSLLNIQRDVSVLAGYWRVANYTSTSVLFLLSVSIEVAINVGKN